MKKCPQTETQSVYEHGLSVKDYTFKLIKILQNGIMDDAFKLPSWFHEYREQIINSLLSKEIIEEYTIFHDCSKPYCLTIDEDGKRHFPNHAELSGKLWLELTNNSQVAKLMGMDMMVHTMKMEEIDNFIQHPEAITLLIVGLAELHSNGSMFGGIESTSFKIKFKKIDKIGKKICQKLFGGNML